MTIVCKTCRKPMADTNRPISESERCHCDHKRK